MKALATLILLTSLLSFSAFAACVAPANPSLPSGATASREEMLSAQQAVKAYNAAMQRHIDCIAKNGELAMVQDKAIGTAKRTLRAVADQFNEELRVFKEKNGS